MEDLSKSIELLSANINKLVEENFRLKSTVNPNATDLARTEAMTLNENMMATIKQFERIAKEYTYLKIVSDINASEEERKQAFEELEKIRNTEQNVQDLSAQFK